MSVSDWSSDVCSSDLCHSAAWGVHRIFYKRYRHVLGHVNPHPGRSNPTHSRHTFDRSLTRWPVSRNWRTRRENHHQKSISHHCQYRVPLDYPESEQLSCSVHLSKYDSIPLSRPHPTFYEPDIMNQIDDAAPHSWKHDHLINAHALLTAAIPNSRNLIHHVLASRAIVRARL